MCLFGSIFNPEMSTDKARRRHDTFDQIGDVPSWDDRSIGQ